MSKQKKLITEILAASYAHPTASQIFEEARKRMPNIALGTVYRNLGVLVDEGTIVRLSVTGLPDRFADIRGGAQTNAEHRARHRLPEPWRPC